MQKEGKPIGWLEFKFGKNILSPDQKDFKNYVENGGFPFRIIRSFEEFKSILQEWGIYDPVIDERARTSQIFKDRRIL